MNAALVDGMYEYLNGKIAYHQANVRVFLSNPVGVAEHGDFMETLEKELEKVAYYQELIGALESINDE